MCTDSALLPRHISQLTRSPNTHEQVKQLRPKLMMRPAQIPHGTHKASIVRSHNIVELTTLI